MPVEVMYLKKTILNPLTSNTDDVMYIDHIQDQSSSRVLNGVHVVQSSVWNCFCFLGPLYFYVFRITASGFPIGIIKTFLKEKFDLIWFLVFNATFSNIAAISWRPVLVVEEAGVPGENHRS